MKYVFGIFDFGGVKSILVLKIVMKKLLKKLFINHRGYWRIV